MSHVSGHFNLTGTQAYLVDLLERIVMTFLMTFGALLLASDVFEVDNILNVELYQAAAVGGLGAALSAIKGVVAKAVAHFGFGRENTAALLPADLDHPERP